MGDYREMFEFGNNNAYVNHEDVSLFPKSDTVIFTSNYHCRLDGNSVLLMATSSNKQFR